MQIHIIGQYPPPIGGITIHIKRLLSKLSKNNYDVRFFDDTDLPPLSLFIKLKNIFKDKSYRISNLFRSEKNYSLDNSIRLKSFRSYLLKLVFTERKSIKIVHYHTKYWKYRALLCAAAKIAKKVKVVITIHSLRDEYSKLSWLERIYLNYSLRHADHLIVTNSQIKNKIVNWGAAKDKVTVLHPFLAPERMQSDYDAIPKEIWDYINEHSPIISANASKIEFYENEDLYGLDMCIDLCSRLKSKHPKIGFIFCLPMVGREEYFEELKKKILRQGIENNFCFILKRYSFYPFLEKSDVFVRPTNTDGDALSVREAISYNIPAVASDVVERPDGTILFRNRNIDDFHYKVSEVLNNRKNSKSESVFDSDESFNKVIDIYKKLSIK